MITSESLVIFVLYL